MTNSSDLPLRYSLATGVSVRKYEELVASGREAIKHLPSVKARFLKGLPKGHQLYVALILTDMGLHERMEVAVHHWKGKEVWGEVATELKCVKLFKHKTNLRIPEDCILDWSIKAPDGTEEGNYFENWPDFIKKT